MPANILSVNKEVKVINSFGFRNKEGNLNNI